MGIFICAKCLASCLTGNGQSLHMHVHPPCPLDAKCRITMSAFLVCPSKASPPHGPYHAPSDGLSNEASLDIYKPERSISSSAIWGTIRVIILSRCWKMVSFVYFFFPRSAVSSFCSSDPHRRQSSCLGGGCQGVRRLMDKWPCSD